MTPTKLFNGNVIDIEASGLDPRSYPIEIGIVLGDGSTYETLIKPEPHWTYWDQEAQTIHGISRQDLMTHGKPINHVCEEINRLCAKQTLYSDCWVYDSTWLNRLFVEAGVRQDFFCTSIEVITEESLLLNWTKLKRDFIESSGITPHRALNDAIIIAETLERITIESEIETISRTLGKIGKAEIKQAETKGFKRQVA